MLHVTGVAKVGGRKHLNTKHCTAKGGVKGPVEPHAPGCDAEIRTRLGILKLVE